MSTSITGSLGESREEIVNLLRTRGGENADQLALSLGVSKQCVRKHLEVLERGGFVEHASVRKERGRPANVYKLTCKADGLFPKRYDIFAKSVLRQVTSQWGQEGLNIVVCGCAAELSLRLRPHLEHLGFGDRVHKLAELLKAEGYEAEAEELPDGSYILTEWNCPAADVAREFNQVCDRELDLYRSLLETRIDREAQIAGGDSRCVYRVQKPDHF